MKTKKLKQKLLVRDMLRYSKKAEFLHKGKIMPPEIENASKISKFLLPMRFFLKSYLTICMQDKVVLVHTT